MPWAAVRRSLAGAVRRDSVFRQADWILVLAVLALSGLGSVLIWSGTAPALIAQGANPHQYLLKQSLNIALGLILMAITASLDKRRLALAAPVLFALSCLGLLAVLSPLGSVVNGARSWISLGAGFEVEPSEFAKLSVIVIGAMLLSRLEPGQTRPGGKPVGRALGLAAVPILLVVAEPDLGVTIVLVLLVAGLIILSGVRLRWIAGLSAAGALAVTAIFKLHLLHSYQAGRLTSFLNPAADPTGNGYSADQSQIAIGSGGLHGTGLFHSTIVAGNFVPEQHTDFIFAIVGNQLGFVGALVVLGLLGVILFRALRIAVRAEDQFGMLVAAGIAIWFAFQTFINVGMTIGIMPVTGLPLPFVSYGGSAMFADMMAVGLLLSVRRPHNVFGARRKLRRAGQPPPLGRVRP